MGSWTSFGNVDVMIGEYGEYFEVKESDISISKESIGVHFEGVELFDWSSVVKVNGVGNE